MAELSIPLKPPTPENPWRVNFDRSYFHRDGADGKTWQSELSCWSPTFGSFHDVSKFGELTFTDGR